MIFVYVCKRDWRHPGPIVNFVTHNAHSVASAGTETHLVLGEGEPSETAADLRAFYGLEPTEHLRIHRVQRKRLIGKSTTSVSIFSRAWRLIRELARRDLVAVITREAAFLPYLVFLRMRGRVLRFYEAHDFYADLSWRRRAPRIQDYRQKWIERLSLPRMNGLICITQAQCELYARLFPKLASIALPLGVKLQPKTHATPENRRRQRTVFYIGHLSSKKGLDLILQIAPQLAQRQVRLALWGATPKNLASWQARLREAGISPEWAEVAEFQPPRVLHEALAARASLGLVVLNDTFYNRYLTCPAKALDYLAHGLPTVASELPSTREVLGPAGRYAAAGSDAEVLREILRLLDDPAEYSQAQEASRRRGEELSWPRRAARLIEFTEGLAKT